MNPLQHRINTLAFSACSHSIVNHGSKTNRKPTDHEKQRISRHTRCDTLCTGRFPLFAEFDPFFTKRYSLHATILTQKTVFTCRITAPSAKFDTAFIGKAIPCGWLFFLPWRREKPRNSEIPGLYHIVYLHFFVAYQQAADFGVVAAQATVFSDGYCSIGEF